MIIAVNTRFLIKEALEGYGYFIKEVFSILTRQYPDHQFYFLFDRPYNKEFIFSDNVHPVIVSPPARHPVLWKYWYDSKIPAILKKIRADVFISPDGYCSLNTKIPQCLVLHDLGFLHYPDTYKRSHLLFYKWYTPKYLEKATAIATVSGFSKKDIIDRYKTDPGKIDVVYSSAKNIFQPVPADEQRTIKEKYTDGAEFFIYAGAIHPRKNLLNLLKAFSIFKKRQKSSMKIVLAGRLAWKNDAFLDLLKRYKYKGDVILTGYLEERELARLMGSAYALVYPSFFEGFGVPVLEAMKTNIPVLTSQNTSMQEVAGDAGLFFDPSDHIDIADKLMLIYKDENLRNRLIENGKQVAALYSWNRTAGLLWETVINAINHKHLP
jgi:glycosyltransferase involved in cell wall biosynthesis